MLFNKDEKSKIKKLHDSVKNSKVKDFYNKFERETDQEFLKEAIAEMKRYERNWSYMKASEKRNIAPGGIKEIKQNIAWAEERLKQLKSGAKDSKVKDYTYNPHKEINAVERFLSGYNSMVTGIEKALKSDPTSAQKLFDKLNKEYEYAEQATGIITAELPKQMEKIYNEMDYLYDEIQEHIAIK